MSSKIAQEFYDEGYTDAKKELEAQLTEARATIATLQAKYEHAYNALLAEQNLVEAARAVVKRHKRKVSLNGLLYHEYESEAVEALAALIDTKGAE